MPSAWTAANEGYSESLDSGGNPFILEENNPPLRAMTLGAEREPNHFWSKLINLPSVTPPAARAIHWVQHSSNFAFRHAASSGNPRLGSDALLFHPLLSISTTVLGIIGAFVATYLGEAIGWYGENEGAGLIGAIVGAVIILLVWGFIGKRKQTTFVTSRQREGICEEATHDGGHTHMVW